MITIRDLQIKDIVEAEYRRRGRPATIKEIAIALRVSKTTIQKHLTKLRTAGYLKFDRGFMPIPPDQTSPQIPFPTTDGV